MRASRLERLLWRYEYGRLSTAHLELETVDAVRSLTDARAAQGVPAALERWSAHTLRATLDAAIAAASTAATSRRFREAIQHIRSAEMALVRIEELMTAADAATAAERSVAEITELAQTPTLQRLPAVLSAVQLVEQIALGMFGAAYGKALALAQLCTRFASALTERRAGTREEQRSYGQRLAVAGELCTATACAASETDVDPMQDGSLERLAWLFDRGNAAMATRLLTQLEIQLAGRRRFRLHFRDINSDNAPRLRELVRQRTWDGAVDYDWQQAMLAYGALLQANAERAESAAANLTTALS